MYCSKPYKSDTTIKDQNMDETVRMYLYYVCMCACMYLPTTPHKQDAAQRQFCSLSLTVLKLEFSFELA